MNINRSTNFILNSLALSISGLLTLVHFHEWYIVKIKGDTSDYPFGGEGPTPYYYKSAELYSKVNLIWGLVFLTIWIFSTWTVLSGRKKLTLISLALTSLFLLVIIIQAQFRVK